MIGTIEYREGNKTFPGLRWCIVRSNGEVYPLLKDDIPWFTKDGDPINVEFVLRSDRYGIGPYASVLKELSKEDFRERKLETILNTNI